MNNQVNPVWKSFIKKEVNPASFFVFKQFSARLSLAFIFGKTLGKHSPLATRFKHVEDCIKNFP